MLAVGSAGHWGSLPQPCAAQGQWAVHLPSTLKLYIQGAGAAVEGFLSYFPMPEPYLLDVCIPVCTTVAQCAVFRAINRGVCGEGCVPGKGL